MAFTLVSVENAGRSSQLCVLPRLDLAGMDLVLGQLGNCLFSLHRLQGATLAVNDPLCFLRPFEMSRSSFKATATLISGAGLSLRNFRVHVRANCQGRREIVPVGRRKTVPLNAAV